ncbi:hypothetical protein P9112_004210 [Eukaryota sp. TZLM1-RC]
MSLYAFAITLLVLSVVSSADGLSVDPPDDLMHSSPLSTSVTFLSPLSSDVWFVGSTSNIVLDISGDFDTLCLYFKDNILISELDMNETSKRITVQWKVPSVTDQSVFLTVKNPADVSQWWKSPEFRLSTGNVSFISPIESSIFHRGDLIEINFAVEGYHPFVDLYYQTDNNSRHLIASNVSTVNSFHWRTSPLMVNSRNIFLVAIDSLGQYSSKVFEIQGAEVLILLQSDSFSQGQRLKFSWEIEGQIEFFNVMLKSNISSFSSQLNTQNEITIGSNINSSLGFFEWVISDVDQGQYYLTLQNSRDVYEVFDSPFFTISFGAFIVNRPSTEDILIYGVPFQVEWKTLGFFPLISIKLVCSGSEEWATIASSVQNQDFFDYTPTKSHLGSKCRIRIVAESRSSRDADSEIFSIIETPFKIFEPEPFSSFQVGQSVMLSYSNMAPLILSSINVVLKSQSRSISLVKDFPAFRPFSFEINDTFHFGPSYLIIQSSQFPQVSQQSKLFYIFEKTIELSQSTLSNPWYWKFNSTVSIKDQSIKSEEFDYFLINDDGVATEVFPIFFDRFNAVLICPEVSIGVYKLLLAQSSKNTIGALTSSFYVKEASIHVTSHFQNAFLFPGSTLVITWNSIGSIDVISVYLVAHTGKAANEIILAEWRPNIHYLYAVIPSNVEPLSEYFVVVADSCNRLLSSRSERFPIYSPPKFQEPKQGQIFSVSYFFPKKILFELSSVSSVPECPLQIFISNSSLGSLFLISTSETFNTSFNYLVNHHFPFQSGVFNGFFNSSNPLCSISGTSQSFTIEKEFLIPPWAWPFIVFLFLIFLFIVCRPRKKTITYSIIPDSNSLYFNFQNEPFTPR